MNLLSGGEGETELNDLSNSFRILRFQWMKMPVFGGLNNDKFTFMPFQYSSSLLFKGI